MIKSLQLSLFCDWKKQVLSHAWFHKYDPVLAKI